MLGTDNADHAASIIGDYLAEVSDAVMPKRECPSPRRSVFWWSEEIATMRKSGIVSLRACQRAGRRGEPRERLKEEFKAARQLLRKTIRKAQEAAWRELLESVEADPWGRAYIIVTKKIGGSPPGAEAVGREIQIADGLLPTATPPDWSVLPLWADTEEDPDPFTLEELEAAAARLPTGKAPGPDGVVNEVLSAVARWNPTPMLGVLNVCLKTQTLPMVWKRARVTLLHKGPTKPVTEPSSFRPISLLDGMGKLLERMLLNRMSTIINGALAPNQFGFRSGRGTNNAIQRVLDVAAEAARGVTQDRHLCVLVTLDVRNAFNTAPWRHIDEACAGVGLPAYMRRLVRSYLADRRILIPSDGRHLCRPMTCGVPQGSVLGPTCGISFMMACCA